MTDGLDYRARYYEPNTGRFISEDPIGVAGGVNFYRYVQNSPSSLIDPMGLIGQEGQQANHSHPPGSCHFPSCFWYYGNWGGPGWTGGQWKPYEDLTQKEMDNLAPPIDAQDACYQEHDFCYSHSRVKNKCTAKEHPTSAQTYVDDQDSAECDRELARCLGRLSNDTAWNPGSAMAQPVFTIKWLLKSTECPPNVCLPPQQSRPFDFK